MNERPVTRPDYPFRMHVNALAAVAAALNPAVFPLHKHHNPGWRQTPSYILFAKHIADLYFIKAWERGRFPGRSGGIVTYTKFDNEAEPS